MISRRWYYTEKDICLAPFGRISDLVAPLGLTPHFEVYSKGRG